MVGLRYRHNIIVLYGLHFIQHILLFSVSYLTSIIMVNVKINYFLRSFSLSLSTFNRYSGMHHKGLVNVIDMLGVLSCTNTNVNRIGRCLLRKLSIYKHIKVATCFSSIAFASLIVSVYSHISI